MKKFCLFLELLIVLSCGCSESQKPIEDRLSKTPFVAIATPSEQEVEIKALVEQLVIADRQATNRPSLNPGMKIYDADGKEVKPVGRPEDTAQYRKRFETCQKAFQKLSEFKIAAFPVLIAHLDDKRQSINFRNHYLGNSVGDACYWNIYFQLTDRPDNYSSYGESRTGRDGQQHTKPYWGGTPFDESGGLGKWLRKNEKLTYCEMQILCLQWLLNKEKEIGACDADSYFENILPLEIRILERRLESGKNVEKELERMKNIMASRDVSSIPADLLPAQ